MNVLSCIQFINYFLFLTIGIFKNSRIFGEKIKPFEFKSNFLSSFVRNNRFKGTVWVAFHGVSKGLFSAFLGICYYSYLNKNFEIVSEKMKIFEFLSNSLHFHVGSNSYLKFLFGSFLCYFQG